ncbi:MAG: cobalamin-dependent protein, partial [Victivallales bacterium]|nr:cobalamin-dependent protein [Victivallales bacterium]
IPETVAGRIELVEKVYAEARKYGYEREDLVLDALIMTVSSNQAAAKISLDLIEWGSREFGVNTACGLSNVSFGMPERKWINAGFLGMALGRGLNMAIANPSEEVLMNLIAAGDVLAERDHKMRRYVEKFGGEIPSGNAASKLKKDVNPVRRVFDAVVNGDEDGMAEVIAAALAAGVPAKTLIDDSLVPAINRVGDLYDSKKYFLPQLIMGADAMRKGFELLEPHLAADAAGNSAEKAVVVLATVEGDIHDIGKNIVALMLRNYGFEVVDLGKDVSALRIVNAAIEHNAHIVGLSALMTTTMVRMEEVVRLARQKGLSDLKIMIGGAVVDQNYADQIGADAYAVDAMESVRIAQRLVGGNN